jgi:galactose mutarotase-like enzyme
MDLVTIANADLRVAISPMGAEMQSITTAGGGEWLWHGDPQFWNGRAPILFPIVGKAPDDQVEIEGQLYPMSQHGFARRSLFAVVEQREDFCRLELRASEVTRAVYPFEFVLAVSYRLEGRRVAVTAEVRNQDGRPLPFGLGFHPAFSWPLPGCAGEEHRVVLDNGGEPGRVRLEGGLLGPEMLASPFQAGRLVLEHNLFDEDALVFPEGAGTGIRFEAQSGAGLHFTWENLPAFALWSKPKMEAPFLCLEPWHGMAARVGAGPALLERPLSLALEPGGVARFGFGVEVLG